MNAAGNYELLIEKINLFIRKYYFNQFLRGLIFLGAGLFSAYVVITVSEYFGNFNILFRSILFYFFIFLNIGFICWLILPSLLAWLKLGKTLTHDQAAEISCSGGSNTLQSGTEPEPVDAELDYVTRPFAVSRVAPGARLMVPRPLQKRCADERRIIGSSTGQHQ